jgi:hypothetical protein
MAQDLRHRSWRPSGDHDRIAQVPREAFTLELARLGRGSEMVKRS